MFWIVYFFCSSSICVLHYFSNVFATSKYTDINSIVPSWFLRNSEFKTTFRRHPVHSCQTKRPYLVQTRVPLHSFYVALKSSHCFHLFSHIKQIKWHMQCDNVALRKLKLKLTAFFWITHLTTCISTEKSNMLMHW